MTRNDVQCEFIYCSSLLQQPVAISAPSVAVAMTGSREIPEIFNFSSQPSLEGKPERIEKPEWKTGKPVEELKNPRKPEGELKNPRGKPERRIEKPKENPE